MFHSHLILSLKESGTPACRRRFRISGGRFSVPPSAARPSFRRQPRFIPSFQAAPFPLFRLPRYCRFCGSGQIAVHCRGFHFSRTGRTAASLCSRPGEDRGFPLIPASAALPPDLLRASAGHVLRSQSSILCRMPFCRNTGQLGGKVVKAWQNLSVRAVGTSASSCCSGLDGCLVFVPFFADPPRTAVALRRYGFGSHDSVFRRMPLCSQLRVMAGKVVHTGNNFLSSAHRTAASACSAVDRCLPVLPANPALPPDLECRTGKDRLWQAFAVFCRMPLCRDFRVGGSKIIFPGHHGSVGTGGATALCAARSRLDLSLPFITAGAAFPPHFPVREG